MTRPYRVAIMMGSMHLLGACLAVGTPQADLSAHLPLRRPATGQRPRVAALVTTYYRNSHADVLISRLLQTHTLEGQGETPPAGWDSP